jgi:hypothetical protein
MMPLVFPVVYTKFRMPQLAQIMVGRPRVAGAADRH